MIESKCRGRSSASGLGRSCAYPQVGRGSNCSFFSLWLSAEHRGMRRNSPRQAPGVALLQLWRCQKLFPATHLSRFLGCQVLILVESYIFISQHDPSILTRCKPAISSGISLFRDNIIARGGTLNQQPHHSGLNLARLWFSFKQMTEKKVIVYLKQVTALLPKKEMNS